MTGKDYPYDDYASNEYKAMDLGQRLAQKGVTIETMSEHPMGKVMLEAFELCLTKNADYGSNTDTFANFRESEEVGTLPSKGCAIRAGDKWRRFRKGVRTDWDMSVGTEGMCDTIWDLINYMCIYKALYLEEKSQ